MTPAALPGQQDAGVYDADFGRIGFATCFDAKFPEVFQRLRDRGAELVVWPSAYSGFTELQAFALLHHYYIVTSTLTGDSILYDITGAIASDQRGTGGVTVARFMPCFTIIRSTRGSVAPRAIRNPISRCR